MQRNAGHGDVSQSPSKLGFLMQMRPQCGCGKDEMDKEVRTTIPNEEEKEPEDRPKFDPVPLMLCEVLPLIKTLVALRVREKSGDKCYDWTLRMGDGKEMLEFLADKTNLVDGQLLLNCEVDSVQAANDAIGAFMRTEVFVDLGHDE